MPVQIDFPGGQVQALHHALIAGYRDADPLRWDLAEISEQVTGVNSSAAGRPGWRLCRPAEALGTGGLQVEQLGLGLGADLHGLHRVGYGLDQLLLVELVVVRNALLLGKLLQLGHVHLLQGIGGMGDSREGLLRLLGELVSPGEYLLFPGALGEEVGIKGPVGLPEVVLPLHNGVQQGLGLFALAIQGLGIVPEYLPVFAVRNGLHALDIGKRVLEVKVKLALGETAIDGVVDGLRLPVALVGVEGVAHGLGTVFADVLEGLLLVDSHQPAGAVGDEVPAVAVVVPQEPVGDVLPLELLRGAVGEGTSAVLPCLIVHGAVNGGDPLLESTKLPAQLSDAHLDGCVRINDVLHLVAGLLDIGPKGFGGAALGLGRLKKPLLAGGVPIQVHFPGASQIGRAYMGHAGRHSNPRGAHRRRGLRGLGGYGLRPGHRRCLWLLQLHGRRLDFSILHRATAAGVCRGRFFLAAI